MRRVIIALATCLWASLAFGQANNSNTWQTPGNQTVGGFVQMCVNTAGNAVPCLTSSGGAAGVPAGATPIGATFSGADTTTAAATLAAAAGKFTYIQGFTVSGLGATSGATVNVTVATLVGGTTATYSYAFATGAAVVNQSLSINFPAAIPANAANSAITITVPGAAGNTATQINAWGYQL